MNALTPHTPEEFCAEACINLSKAFEARTNFTLYSRYAGENLLSAKKLVRHGEWFPFLKKHCPHISRRYAQKLMKLARVCLANPDFASKTQTMALRDVFEMLSTPKAARVALSMQDKASTDDTLDDNEDGAPANEEALASIEQFTDKMIKILYRVFSGENRAKFDAIVENRQHVDMDRIQRLVAALHKQAETASIYADAIEAPITREGELRRPASDSQRLESDSTDNTHAHI